MLQLNRNGWRLPLFLATALLMLEMVQGQTNPSGVIDFRLGGVKTNDEFQRNVVISVIGDSKRPLDRQSVVKLYDKNRDKTLWQTTEDDSRATFGGLAIGEYDVEVSAAGYLSKHKDMQVVAFTGLSTGNSDFHIDVDLQKDPTAIDLTTSDDAMPSKARKEVKRAAYDLRSGNLGSAQKRLDKISPLAPSSPQVNFLYGYLFWELKDFEKAQTHLSEAVVSDPQRIQPLALLGRVQLQLHHYDDAQKTLERVVSANSEYWMAHNLLADAYLFEKNYEKARVEAQFAIDHSAGAGSAANLVLGQALANLGRYEEGIGALQRFLQTNPANSAVPQVKNLIAKIEKRDSEVTILPEDDPTLAADPPSLPPSSWGPPGVDEVKPSVAADVPCPTQQVLENSGERIKELVDNVSRFAAVEDMVHEQLDKTGNPVSKETRKFDYVASISEEQPGFLATHEFRNLRYGVTTLPDGIATTGFVTLALVFHPLMREDFEMTCEGLGDWQGQAAWLVHFRQRDDRPNRFADYVVGSTRYPMKLKGRAWIAAKNFQIVRIESDLVNSLPQLAVQHQVAEYGPVPFQNRNLELWLPQKADIYIDLKRHLYHRRHSFDHYMLFSVDAEHKSVGIKKGSSTLPLAKP